VKIKPPLEKVIQKSIIDYLKLAKKDKLKVWRNNNGAIWNAKRKSYIKNPTAEIGVPDIIGFTHYGIFIAIEVKRTEKSQRSKEQIDFITMVNKVGGIAFFTWSVEHTIKMLKERGL